MGYVSENLMPGERVVHGARLHWIIFVKAAVMVVLSLWMFTGGSQRVGLATFFLLLGIVLGLSAAVELQISEFAVTDRRVLAKTGLVRRHSRDINLGKVESLEVEQGILGRLLDYGTIIVKGSGGTPESFRNISDPLAFRLYVQDQAEQRTRAETASPSTSAALSAREERECPYCAEIILARAKVCRHCGRDVIPALA